MENTDKKNNTIWIVLLVIVVALVAIFFLRKEKATDMTDDNTPTALEVTEDTTEGSVNAPATAGVAPVTISYEDAVIKYKDSRIQLGTGAICTATPNNVTYKNGTTIMIDNRAPTARSLKIGSMYSVKGYSFKLIKLSSGTLPAKLLLDCDSQQNVATILLQA